MRHGVLLSLLALLAACDAPPPAASPRAPTTGRTGVHGMVVFGGGAHVFVSHIPMFRPPHDMQVIAEVTWTGGPRSFNDRLYTFEPKPFSLDAFILGEVTDVQGALYEGSFEAGGRPLEMATMHVERIVYAHPLDPAAHEALAPDYMTVGDGEDAALVRIIRGAPGVDEILVASSHRTLSCLVGPDFDKPCAK